MSCKMVQASKQKARNSSCNFKELHVFGEKGRPIKTLGAVTKNMLDHDSEWLQIGLRRSMVLIFKGKKMIQKKKNRNHECYLNIWDKATHTCNMSRGNKFIELGEGQAKKTLGKKHVKTKTESGFKQGTEGGKKKGTHKGGPTKTR